MILNNIDIASLLRAQALFEKYSTTITSEIEKLAAIKTFEMCFELSWKTMKRLLDKRGVNVTSPREVIRAAAAEGFIKDPEIWFIFLGERNSAFDCYDKNIAHKVSEILPSFSQQLSLFLKNQ